MRAGIFIITILLLLPSTLADCLVPFSNMELASSATLCQGTYEVENIVVEGFGTQLVCNQTILQGAQSGAGIVVQNAHEAIIGGCTLQDYEVGISVKGSSDIILENNKLVRNKIGIAEQSSSTMLQNNIYEGSIRQDVMTLQGQQSVEDLSQEQFLEEQRSFAAILREELVYRNAQATEQEIAQQVQKLLDDLQQSQEYLDIQRTITMDRDKNTTTITLTIVPQQSLEDVKIYESIPKCVAEYVHQAIFSNTDYEVLKQDPLIMWTFSSMQQHEQISYTVSKLLSKECLSLLNGLGIAKPKKVQKPAESIPNAHKASSRLLGLSAMLFAIILIARYFHLKK